MPTIKSAKKRMNLSRAAREKNRAERARIRTAVKNVRQADSAETAEARLRDAIALLDRAATKNLMHANRVARVKGQLQKHVNSLA
jgi:small subunit ribosomal protein S20